MEQTILIIVKLLILGLSIGFGVYFAKYAKPFLLWLKNGIEDGDGKLQHHELQIAYFSLLAGFIVFSYAIWEINYPDAIIYSVFAGAGVFFSVNRIAKMREKQANKGTSQGRTKKSL